MRQDICDRTFEFAVKVVRLCNRLIKTGASGRVLGNQLLLECFNRFGQYMLRSKFLVGLKDPEEVKSA